MSPVAVVFWVLAVAMIPGWLLTGCTQNGLWLLGILFASLAVFAQCVHGAQDIPPTHPDSLGFLDRADRAHRKEPAVTGMSSIQEITHTRPLPEVTREVAAGLCDEHLADWIRRFSLDRIVYSHVVALRVVAGDRSERVRVVAQEAVRLDEALSMLESERAERATARRVAS